MLNALGVLVKLLKSIVNRNGCRMHLVVLCMSEIFTDAVASCNYYGSNFCMSNASFETP